MFSELDRVWMQRAIALAQCAEERNEVPVGAVLVADNKIIGKGSNCPIATNDPTAHAEIVALRDASLRLQNYRLIDTTLYVTLEPCVMCEGAIVHARVKRVVYGAFDPKGGAVCSAHALGESVRFNHRVEYAGGLLAEECGVLLKQFFQKRR